MQSGISYRQRAHVTGRMKFAPSPEVPDPEPAPGHRTPAQALLRRTGSFCRRSVDHFSPGVRSRSVSARALLSEKCEKELDRFLLALEMMHQPLTPSTDASPSTDEARLTEQRWFDRHCIVAGHVFRRVYPLDIKLVGLCNHGGKIAQQSVRVQREI